MVYAQTLRAQTWRAPALRCRECGATYVIEGTEKEKASCVIRLAMSLRRHAGNATIVHVRGACVGQALLDLQDQFPSLTHLLAEEGQLPVHLIVLVNDVDIRQLEGLDTPLREGDVLTLLQEQSI